MTENDSTAVAPTTSEREAVRFVDELLARMNVRYEGRLHAQDVAAGPLLADYVAGKAKGL